MANIPVLQILNPESNEWEEINAITGNDGAPGVTLSGEGPYGFYINSNGELICCYQENTNPPDFEIVDGNLIYRY